MLADINQCRLQWTEDNSLLAVAMSSGTVEVIWFHFSEKMHFQTQCCSTLPKGA